MRDYKLRNHELPLRTPDAPRRWLRWLVLAAVIAGLGYSLSRYWPALVPGTNQAPAATAASNASVIPLAVPPMAGSGGQASP